VGETERERDIMRERAGEDEMRRDRESSNLAFPVSLISFFCAKVMSHTHRR
jgi:hypothetical protein